MKKFTILIFAIVFLLSGNVVFADDQLSLNCAATILIEETSGKVLYAKDADKKMFPASMTKILTALVALEYLKPDEYIVTGDEINEVPYDSSKAWHIMGETLLVENLIRGLIIPSGNETACVVARAVAKKIKNVDNISYAEAEKLFCDLMNEKAKELGAVNSNFSNPHGYHSERHYTTARDMALIARAAMGNSLIRSIVAELSFVENGAGANPPEGAVTKEYQWATHNQLIIKGDPFYYEYATGIKTGYTGEAGSVVTASAEKDGRKLIAVVMLSTDTGRWEDAKTLFEYGFDNFDDLTVQTEGQVMVSAKQISNPRLGDDETLDLVAEQDVIRYLSKDELSRIQNKITINEELIAPQAEGGDGVEMLLAPLTTGQAVGTVTYTLDDEILYEGNIISPRLVEPRSLKSDLNYYKEKSIKAVFSLKAIPFWIGGAVAILFVVRSILRFNYRKRQRRNKYKFVKRR